MNGETLVEFAEADGSSDLFAVVLSIRAGSLIRQFIRGIDILCDTSFDTLYHVWCFRTFVKSVEHRKVEMYVFGFFGWNPHHTRKNTSPILSVFKIAMKFALKITNFYNIFQTNDCLQFNQNGVCSYFLASNEHLFVRLLWGFTCTYELMLKKKAILHIAFLVIVHEVQYESLRFVLVQCVELHFLSGPLSGKLHRKKLLLIECDKSFVDICGRTASPLHALPYTVRKATESMGAATTTKRPASRNDQKAIPKGAPFATPGISKLTWISRFTTSILLNFSANLVLSTEATFISSHMFCTFFLMWGEFHLKNANTEKQFIYSSACFSCLTAHAGCDKCFLAIVILYYAMQNLPPPS
ncbi:hypothetical protein T02_10953 [Trichinella nativa]|uniref:Uncharacterized protein n=1 Tax=Trichinella nativa TaxID=6335 RepID=A0A0V1KXG3_9BILA|nr:hypothetical protein T02_10953 [Trichinella nativa]